MRRALNTHQENQKELPKYQAACGSQQYSRKPNRPPLGGLQEVAQRTQHSTVDYGQQQAAKIDRSKAASSVNRQTLATGISPIKPISRQCGSAAGTTRVAPCSYIKDPTFKITGKERFKPSTSTAVPSRSRSTSCRCTGNRQPTNYPGINVRQEKRVLSIIDNDKFTENYNVEYDHDDDVFLHPNSANTARFSQASNVAIKSSNLSTVNPKKSPYSNYINSTQRSSTADKKKYFYDRRINVDSLTSNQLKPDESCPELNEQNFMSLAQDTLQMTRCTITPDLRSTNVGYTRESSFFSQAEQTFVDGESFFKDLDSGLHSTKTIKVYSPIELNVPVRRGCIKKENARKPAVKTTLSRRTSARNSAESKHLYYSHAYLEDIIEYSLSCKTYLLLNSGWIRAYMDRHNRTATINWIMQISQLVVPNFDPVFYMSVRLFDWTVFQLKLRKSHYQLAAIVSFWISLKYLDNSVLLKVPKMYALCNGKYSKGEILTMERDILKKLDFHLNIPDPLDFLHYYLKFEKMETIQVLKFGATFVLECSTLFENYAIKDPSFHTFCALYLAYKVLNQPNNVSLSFKWFNAREVCVYTEVLITNVKYAIVEKYEPLNKYSTVERMNVAKDFFGLL